MVYCIFACDEGQCECHYFVEEGFRERDYTRLLVYFKILIVGALRNDFISIYDSISEISLPIRKWKIISEKRVKRKKTSMKGRLT